MTEYRPEGPDTEDTVVTTPPFRPVVPASPIVDAEDTRLRAEGIDEDTRQAPRHDDLDDATIVVRDGVDPHDTVLRRPAPSLDRTIVTGAAAPDDETVVTDSRGASAPRATVVRPVPGRLSGGRVAQVPTSTPERYGVRDASAAPRPDVVRTVIPAPVSPVRQTRDTRGAQIADVRRRRSSGALTVLLVVGVTVVTLAAVAGVIVLLLSLS